MSEGLFALFERLIRGIFGEKIEEQPVQGRQARGWPGLQNPCTATPELTAS
jgi:hypothetical protein